MGPVVQQSTISSLFLHAAVLLLPNTTTASPPRPSGWAGAQPSLEPSKAVDLPLPSALCLSCGCHQLAVGSWLCFRRRPLERHRTAGAVRIGLVRSLPRQSHACAMEAGQDHGTWLLTCSMGRCDLIQPSSLTFCLGRKLGSSRLHVTSH
jgi:hypothetical protein